MSYLIFAKMNYKTVGKPLSQVNYSEKKKTKKKKGISATRVHYMPSYENLKV